MPPSNWLKDNTDKLLLCALFVFTVVVTIYLEAHWGKDDTVIVNWGMQLAGPIEGAILTLIIGKAREAANNSTHSGPTVNVTPPAVPASPDGAAPVAIPQVNVTNQTTASGNVGAPADPPVPPTETPAGS